jgi:hypothetical protein
MEYNGKTIITDKILNSLDILVLEFAQILKKHSPYVLISGYVAILLGRTRATEDVDIFVMPFSKDVFARLYAELKGKGYWCLNAESADEIYSYLADRLAVRFAKEGQTVPNFEVKFAKTALDMEAFNDSIEVITEKGTLNISSLERQIAYKKHYLKSDKDLEDAMHLEEVFAGKINFNKVEQYRNRIEHEILKTRQR